MDLFLSVGMPLWAIVYLYWRETRSAKHHRQNSMLLSETIFAEAMQYFKPKSIDFNL